MEFKKLVESQSLSATDYAYLEYVCRSWIEFSNTIGQMDRGKILKMLCYLTRERPHSKTFGERAVQRYNTLNKVRWGDLTDGDRESSGTTSEEADGS
jgi:hypothetical protein